MSPQTGESTASPDNKAGRQTGLSAQAPGFIQMSFKLKFIFCLIFLSSGHPL